MKIGGKRNLGSESTPFIQEKKTLSRKQGQMIPFYRKQ